MPDAPSPHWTGTVVIVMLTVTSGLQRTACGYQGLLARYGFRTERVLETPSGIPIVGGRPA